MPSLLGLLPLVLAALAVPAAHAAVKNVVVCGGLCAAEDPASPFGSVVVSLQKLSAAPATDPAFSYALVDGGGSAATLVDKVAAEATSNTTVLLMTTSRLAHVEALATAFSASRVIVLPAVDARHPSYTAGNAVVLPLRLDIPCYVAAHGLRAATNASFCSDPVGDYQRLCRAGMNQALAERSDAPTATAHDVSTASCGPEGVAVGGPVARSPAAVTVGFTGAEAVSVNTTQAIIVVGAAIVHDPTRPWAAVLEDWRRVVANVTAVHPGHAAWAANDAARAVGALENVTSGRRPLQAIHDDTLLPLLPAPSTALVVQPLPHVVTDPTLPAAFSSGIELLVVEGRRYVLSPGQRGMARLDLISDSFDASQLGFAFPRGAASVSLPNATYVFGGVNDLVQGSFSQTLQAVSLDPATGALVQTTVAVQGDSPPPRIGHSAVLVGGRTVLVYGGISASLQPLNQLWQFDVATARWELLTTANPPSSGRYHHSAVVWERAMVMGGVEDTQWMVVAGGRASVVLFDVHLYAINRRAWVGLPSAGQPVVQPCLAIFEPRLLVIAGSTEGIDFKHVSIFNAVSAAWALDHPISGDWSGGVAKCVAHSDRVDLLLPAASVRAGGLVQLRYRTVACPDPDEVADDAGLKCGPCPVGRIAHLGRCVPCADFIQHDSSQADKIHCDSTYRIRGIVALAVLLLCQLLLPPVVWVCMALKKRFDTARRNQEAAAELSEAIASMKFERIAYFDVLERPTRIERALMYCAENIKLYRTFIPDPTLCIVDECVQNAQEELKQQGRADADRLSDRHSETDEEDTHELVTVSSGSSGAGRLFAPRGDEAREETFSDQGASGKRAGVVASKLLDSLECHIQVVPCAVLVTNVVGMHQWMEKQPMQRLPRRLAQYHDAVMQQVRQHEGITDCVLGDKIFASWNAAIMCDDYTLRAAQAAYDISRSRAIDALNLTVPVGCASGKCSVGIVGDSRHKHHVVLSPVVSEAVAMSEAAAQARLAVVVPWKWSEPLKQRFVVRLAGAARSMRTQTETLVAELMAPTEDQQWLYELRGVKDQVETCNTAMLGVFRGQVERVQKLVKLKDLPQGYAQEIKEAFRTGHVPSINVPGEW